MKNKLGKFLYYCHKNEFMISMITVIICCGLTAISTLIFKNIYLNTNWYWSVIFYWLVSFLGCGIIYFVNFCIIDEKDDYKYLKTTKKIDNEKEISNI